MKVTYKEEHLLFIGKSNDKINPCMIAKVFSYDFLRGMWEYH